MLSLKGLPTTMTYRYSGRLHTRLHTRRVDLNERLYPKHQAALKRAYIAYVTPLIIAQRPKRLERCAMIYTLVVRDKRRRDRSNILTAVEKIVNDAMVKCGVLPDDDDSVVVKTLYRTEKVPGIGPSTVSVDVIDAENIYSYFSQL